MPLMVKFLKNAHTSFKLAILRYPPIISLGSDRFGLGITFLSRIQFNLHNLKMSVPKA